MSYFNAELGVPCSLDPEGKLTFKGRFTPKQIESVVRKYMIGKLDPPPPLAIPPAPPLPYTFSSGFSIVTLYVKYARALSF